MPTVVQAPGVAKIANEHRILYGGVAVSAALSIYATATVSEGAPNTFTIELPLLNERAELDGVALERLNDLYKGMKKDNAGITSYIEANKNIHKSILGLATIAARLKYEYGVEVLGKRVVVTSDIPMTYGLASSGAVGMSVTVGLVVDSEKVLSKDTIIDVARDNDRMVHEKYEAGGTDAVASWYGKIALFDKDKNNGQGESKPLDVEAKIEIILSITSKKPPTKVAIDKVAALRKEKPEYVEGIFKEMDKETDEAIDAIKAGDIERLGKVMTRLHEQLRKLGVSTDRLDEFVKKMESLDGGGKLSGGGLGGAAIGVTKNPEHAVEQLRKEGFPDARVVEISQWGASKYLKGRSKT